jgi:hypothetical protein
LSRLSIEGTQVTFGVKHVVVLSYRFQNWRHKSCENWLLYEPCFFFLSLLGDTSPSVYSLISTCIGLSSLHGLPSPHFFLQVLHTGVMFNVSSKKFFINCCHFFMLGDFHFFYNAILAKFAPFELILDCIKNPSTIKSRKSSQLASHIDTTHWHQHQCRCPN